MRNLHNRQEEILKILREQKRATIEYLVESLEASPATIRRDLTYLENEGLIVRIHGGAIFRESENGEIDFQKKERIAFREKAEIARLALSELPESGCLFLDSGSTVLALARLLMGKSGYQIFTNSLPILSLGLKLRSPVAMIGGNLRHVSQALTGAMALHWMENLHFDVAILGASGLSLTEGASTTELEECLVKQATIARSRKCVLLADRRKLGKPAPVNFANWEVFDAWITAGKANAVNGGSLDFQCPVREISPRNSAKL